MNFIIGNYYKTRDGRKAKYICNTLLCKDNCRLVFEVQEWGSRKWYIRGYYESGKYADKLPHELDIISEWEDEPKKIERVPPSHDMPYKDIPKKLNEIIDAINKLQEKQ